MPSCQGQALWLDEVQKTSPTQMWFETNNHFPVVASLMPDKEWLQHLSRGLLDHLWFMVGALTLQTLFLIYRTAWAQQQLQYCLLIYSTSFLWGHQLFIICSRGQCVAAQRSAATSTSGQLAPRQEQYTKCHSQEKWVTLPGPQRYCKEFCLRC